MSEWILSTINIGFEMYGIKHTLCNEYASGAYIFTCNKCDKKCPEDIVTQLKLLDPWWGQPHE